MGRRDRGQIRHWAESRLWAGIGFALVAYKAQEVVHEWKETLGNLTALLFLKQCELGQVSRKNQQKQTPKGLEPGCLKLKSVLCSILFITCTISHSSIFASVSETVRATGILKSTDCVGEDSTKWAQKAPAHYRELPITASLLSVMLQRFWRILEERCQ